MCMLLLTGCVCKHDQWEEASCEQPRTCEKCGQTEGSALSHVWFAATCDMPMTCQNCDATKGEALGHDWVDACCTEAKHCSRCKITEGEALGHHWLDATTEQPKTCSICGETEGERIITDPRFTTASAKPLLGRWKYTFHIPAKYLELLGLNGPLNFSWVLSFGDAGDASMSIYFDEDDTLSDAAIERLAKNMYYDYLAEGMDEEEARAAIIAKYGVDADSHVRILLDSISINESPLSDLFSRLEFDGVYYVEDDVLYRGLHWDGQMMVEPYILDGDTLLLENHSKILGKKILFTRATEE